MVGSTKLFSGCSSLKAKGVVVSSSAPTCAGRVADTEQQHAGTSSAAKTVVKNLLGFEKTLMGVKKGVIM